MTKHHSTKPASQAPLCPLPDATLVHVTGGSATSIDVEAQNPVVWMREIVHIQARGADET